MAKRDYSPDSGHNSHNSVSMTGKDFPMPDTMSIGIAAPEPGGAPATKATPSTIVTSIH
jgi:hypothetical protein